MGNSHNYGKIGKALVGVLDVADWVVFSSQVFTVLAGLLLAMLVSFGQQFISAYIPTRQKVETTPEAFSEVKPKSNFP